MRWIAEAVQGWVRSAFGRRVALAEPVVDAVPELLSLGGDGSGDAYVLNLTTGAGSGGDAANDVIYRRTPGGA